MASPYISSKMIPRIDFFAETESQICEGSSMHLAAEVPRTPIHDVLDHGFWPQRLANMLTRFYDTRP